MPTATKSDRTQSTSSENALARAALEAIQQIDRESQDKKRLQVQSLHAAKVAIEQQIANLNRQLTQIDAAIASIYGRPIRSEKRPRRAWDDDRQRIVRWMQAHAGKKFGAGDLIREFPELDGLVMTTFFKPLITERKVLMDTSQGVRRAKYFVAV